MSVHTAALDPKFRRHLANLNRADRYRTAVVRQHEVNFTDLGRDLEAPPKSSRIESPRLILGIQSQVRELPGCAACGGERLPKYAYCARCHRSGVDHLLPNVVVQTATVAEHDPAKFRPKGGCGA